MSFFHALLADRSVDTTPDGKQAFLFIGDSNADGRGTSIPTVASETLYKWNGTGIDEITTQTVANDGSYGSIWQYFATEYKSSHNKKVVGIFRGHSGATFNGIGIAGDNDFGSTGVRYAGAVSAANAALTFLGLEKLKAVVVNLGLNDISSSGTTGNITAEIAWFVAEIQSDFPDTPILFIMPGQAATNDDNNGRGYVIRNHLVQTMENNPNCHLFAAGLAYAYVASAYNADFIHYENVMLENLGKQLSRWFSNSNISNKWARSVVTAHWSNLSAPHKALVAEVVTGLYDDGIYLDCEQIANFKTEAYQDVFLDWTFLGFFGYSGAHGFSANSHVASNGTNSLLFASYANSLYNRTGAGQNNFLVGIKLKDNVTGAGTTAVLLSRVLTGGTAGIRIAQNTTTTIYMANDSANANGAESALADNTFYAVGRNGGTRYLYKNKTLNASNADASEGQANRSMFIGANIEGTSTISLYLSAQYEYFFALDYDTTKYNDLYDWMEYLIANW